MTVTRENRESGLFCELWQTLNTIYLFSFVETPRKFIIARINLRGVPTKLNKFCIIIRVRSAFSLVASCVLLKYTRTDDVN